MTMLAAACLEVLLLVALSLLARDRARELGCKLEFTRLEALLTLAVTLLCGLFVARLSSNIALRLVAIACGGVCALTDWQTGYVFDRVVLFAALICGAACLALGQLEISACGALISGGTLAVLYVATKRRGVGLGDVKLGALLGACIGRNRALPLLAIAFVLGGFVASALVISGCKRRTDTIPFAPFLALGGCIVGAFGG